MTWTNKVVWQEGMFLRAQHFQQQDRYLEAMVRGRAAALRPHPWGITEMMIDRDLLATGRFAIASAAGVFEDGTPFVVPGETDHPVPLDLPESARNVVVYLALPVRQPGAVEVASSDGTDGRFALAGFEAYDTHSGSPQSADIQVGKLRMRYMLETDDRSGYLCIGLARVVEVAADKRVSLDDRWIPPALVCGPTPLGGWITELSGMLSQRAEVLAARYTAPGARGASEVQDFLLLLTINRWQPLLAHWGEVANVHPEDLYRSMLQLAGEMATFTDTNTRRPNTYPAYRHEDLQRSFAPVIADLRRALSAVLESSAVPIPLREYPNGMRAGPIEDRSILRGSMLVLVVEADMPTETLRRLFPSQVKIAARERIKEHVLSQLPGIPVRAMPSAPRQIPFHAGATYFELDRNSPHWQHMLTSAGFAIHVSGEYPNLRMELWAIRG